MLNKHPLIVQSLSCAQQSLDCRMPGFSVLHYLMEFAQIHVHWVSDAIQPSHLLPPSSPLPTIFPRIRVFSNESALLIRCPKYWSFSFSISPSNEYSGLISFRMDWLDVLAVQRSLKSLLQHHSSKATILQCLYFFMVQLSHLYMATGKKKKKLSDYCKTDHWLTMKKENCHSLPTQDAALTQLYPPNFWGQKTRSHCSFLSVCEPSWLKVFCSLLANPVASTFKYITQCWHMCVLSEIKFSLLPHSWTVPFFPF